MELTVPKDKGRKKRHNIFDPVDNQESPERNQEEYKQIDPTFMDNLGTAVKSQDEFEKVEPRLIQHVLAEKARQNKTMVVHEVSEQ